MRAAEDRRPESWLDAWDRFDQDIRELGRVMLGELRSSWQPWAIGCGLAWLGLVAVTIAR